MIQFLLNGGHPEELMRAIIDRQATQLETESGAALQHLATQQQETENTVTHLMGQIAIAHGLAPEETELRRLADQTRQLRQVQEELQQGLDEKASALAEQLRRIQWHRERLVSLQKALDDRPPSSVEEHIVKLGELYIRKGCTK